MKPEKLQDELSRAAVEDPGLQEVPQLELQEAPAEDHVTLEDPGVLYDDVPAETGARALDSGDSESLRPARSLCGNVHLIFTHGLRRFLLVAKDAEDVYEDVQPVSEQRSNGWSSNEFESCDDDDDDDADDDEDAAPPACRSSQVSPRSSSTRRLAGPRNKGAA